MLLERFGLWEVRDQRVSTFSRGMRQRLGLCRVLLHDPSLVILDEPFNALDEAGSELLDATLDELAARSAVDRRDPRPGAGRAARDPEARVRMTYFSDVAALARKDLLIELRAKETVPAMLLFVISTLVVFHFAVPVGRRATRSRSASSGSRSSSRRCSA